MTTRESVLDLMTASAAVFLANTDGGAPRIRALENLRRNPRSAEFCRAEGFTCYFATSAASGKVRELRANPAAAAYYCDPTQVHGVTISGRVEVLDDLELRRALWRDPWSIYWRGPEDPDYVVLRLVPDDVRGWWGTVPFALEVRAA